MPRADKRLLFLGRIFLTSIPPAHEGVPSNVRFPRCFLSPIRYLLHRATGELAVQADERISADDHCRPQIQPDCFGTEALPSREYIAAGGAIFASFSTCFAHGPVSVATAAPRVVSTRDTIHNYLTL
jgi:hypothetical protein